MLDADARRGGRSVVNQQHSVLITSIDTAGWSDTRPIVVRVVIGDDLDHAPVVVERSLGLSMPSGRPPVWEELARRADVALAEAGWARTKPWEHHVWPQPIAQAIVSKT
jgi:hypothetical protein